jgi:hypothetical protein
MIEYRARLLRPGYVFLGLLLVALGLLLVGSQRATRISCDRYGDSVGGFCAIRRYAIVGAFDVDVPLEAIDTLDVRRVKGSKGSEHAEVGLRMSRESGRGDLEIETSSWIGISPEIAFEARSALIAFKQQPSVHHFDVWLRRSVPSAIMMAIFALGVFALGVVMLREQLGQLRPIRVVVDHERGVVLVRGQEISIRKIESVDVELGSALYWSSGKGEHVPGYRVVIARRGGGVIPVTQEYRAGDAAVHDRARKDILGAIGRAVDRATPLR